VSANLEIRGGRVVTDKALPDGTYIHTDYLAMANRTAKRRGEEVRLLKDFVEKLRRDERLPEDIRAEAQELFAVRTGAVNRDGI